MNDVILVLSVCFVAAVLSVILGKLSVKVYKKRQPSDPTAARHREIHNTYVKQATELGVDLTGRETSSEVSYKIGVHNRKKALEKLEASADT